MAGLISLVGQVMDTCLEIFGGFGGLARYCPIGLVLLLDWDLLRAIRIFSFCFWCHRGGPTNMCQHASRSVAKIHAIGRARFR